MSVILNNAKPYESQTNEKKGSNKKYDLREYMDVIDTGIFPCSRL